MPEIRDSVIKQIVERIGHNVPFVYCDEDELAKLILSIPELAIVDREAELLINPWSEDSRYDDEIHRALGYNEAQQDMLKAGWVKEVKDA